MNSAVRNGVDDTIATVAALIEGEAVVLRREARMRLVAAVDGIVFGEALSAEGGVVFAKACDFGFEGIVSKRAGSFVADASA